MTRRLLLPALLLLAAAAPAQVYVAAGGDDGGPGSLDRPFAPLERAQAEVRRPRQAGPDRRRTVLLRGGAHRP
nr:hypothetical protein [Planctomycetota bacterium]